MLLMGLFWNNVYSIHVLETSSHGGHFSPRTPCSSVILMLLGLLYCPGERSSCRIKCSRKIITVYILLVIVNSATSSSWRNQRRQNRSARCLKYKHKWDHMPMIPARAPVWLPFCSQTHSGCIFWSEWWQQQNLWLCHVFKDHRRLIRALWTAAHTRRVGTKTD